MGTFKKQEVWWIDYYVCGKRRRERIGPSKKLAKEVLLKRKLEIAEGKFSPFRQQKTISFSEMADMYWELHAKHKPSASVTPYTLIQLKSHFGNSPLDKIAVPDVLKYLNGVKEKSSAATANRHHNILRAIFNRAIEWEKFNGKNPAAKVKQFRVENSNRKPLEDADKNRLLSECDEVIRPIVIFALLTGMRRGEILNLSWEHLDLTHGVIHVLKTKSGDPREIPITDNLKALIDTLPREDNGNLFTISTRALNSHFSKALKLAGIANFRFHDLRHTFASDFVDRTNDLPSVQRLLGHKSSRMTQRYVHLLKGHLQAGMAIFNAGWTPIRTPGQNTDTTQIKEKTTVLEELSSEKPL